MQPILTEPPFDPRWLDLLAGALATTGESSTSLADLYLERRIEIRLRTVGSSPQMEIVRSAGSAARWIEPERVEITAITGTAPRSLAQLLANHHDARILATARPMPQPELDAPRSWLQWATDLTGRLHHHRPEVVYLARRAVVVQAGQWVTVGSPDLVRVRKNGDHPASLLAVWGHPDLATWIHQLFEPQPQKRWAPDPGAALPVLFRGGSAGVLLHELVGHLMEADLVVSGDSPLAGLLGATVAPTSITLSDDPTRRDLAGAFDHDDEGVPAASIDLIRDGRLNAWLCDHSGAHQLGGVPGRGRRSSWSRPPVPRLSNLILHPGATNPSDLEAGLKLGLVITRLGAATVDPVSARTVIRVEEGWEIRNGRRRRPLGRLELVGDVLQVLAGIDPAVGNDPTVDWRLGWCVKGGWPLATGSEAPSILVRGLEVL